MAMVIKKYGKRLQAVDDAPIECSDKLTYWKKVLSNYAVLNLDIECGKHSQYSSQELEDFQKNHVLPFIKSAANMVDHFKQTAKNRR